MKSLRQKITDSQGESLVEVLASVLIGSLAILLLASMIAASVQINRKAQAYDADYYENLTRAERQQPGDEWATADSLVTVTETGSADAPVSVEVTYYGGDGICSYKLKESGTP